MTRPIAAIEAGSSSAQRAFFRVVLSLLACLLTTSCSPQRAARAVVRAMTRETKSDPSSENGRSDSKAQRALEAKDAD